MTLERWIALVAGGLLVLAAFAWGRASYRRGDGPLTPLSLFSIVWGLTLLLFAIPWVRYTPTRAGVWIVVYGSIVTFMAGAHLAQRRNRTIERVEPAQRELPDGRRLRLVWSCVAVLGLVGFGAYVHAVDVVVGWRALFDNPPLVRDIQSTSSLFTDTYGPWKLLTYCNQIAFLLWTLGMRERMFGGRWRVGWLLGPLSLVPFIFTGDRTLILLSLLWAAFFHLLYGPQPSVRRLMVIVAAGVAGVVLVFGLLGSRVDKTIDSHPEIAKTLSTSTFDSLALPYVYVTANVPTFAGLTEDPLAPKTYGQLTVLPAVKVLHGLGVWGQPPEVVGAYYPIPFETFNNYSWLGTMYLDFGVVGCLVLPLLIGYLITAITLRAIRRRTLLSIWTASLLLYCTAFSPLLPRLFDTLTWQYLIIGPVVITLIGPDSSRLREFVRGRVASARARPLLAGLGSAVIAGLLGIALVGVLSAQSTAALPQSEQALAGKLRAAYGWAKETRRDGEYPTAVGLASRLHVHDPGTRYVGLGHASDATADAQSIGVYARGQRLVLRARSGTAGPLVSLDTASLDSDLLSVDPSGRARLGEQLVVNGGFEDGYSGWSTGTQRVATREIAEPGYESRRKLLVRGTGGKKPALHFRQNVYVDAPQGSCFSFRVRAKREDLSRHLLTFVSLNHADGTGDQIVVGARKHGLPPGSSGWREFRVVGRATAPVAGIVVRAVETARRKLHGTVSLDDLSLERVRCNGVTRANNAFHTG